jgi:tRNA A37 threonylcarbamoyladenosine dehydratase
MSDRLHRTRLLFGDTGIEKLQKATVMIVGCGAVGSFAVEALARTCVGKLIIIDSDVIEESNINRQIFATDTTIEMLKVDVARARIHDINPDILVTAIRTFFDDLTELNVTPDFVIDAIDTVPSKIALYKWCVARNIPFISSMGAARKTNPSCIKIAKLSKTTVCPLAAKIRKMVRDANLPDFDVVYSTEPAAPTDAARVFGSIVTVTGIFGLMAANHAINYIINH